VSPYGLRVLLFCHPLTTPSPTHFRTESHRLGEGQWAGPPLAIGQGRVIYNDLSPE